MPRKIFLILKFCFSLLFSDLAISSSNNQDINHNDLSKKVMTKSITFGNYREFVVDITDKIGQAAKIVKEDRGEDVSKKERLETLFQQFLFATIYGVQASYEPENNNFQANEKFAFSTEKTSINDLRVKKILECLKHMAEYMIMEGFKDPSFSIHSHNVFSHFSNQDFLRYLWPNNHKNLYLEESDFSIMQRQMIGHIIAHFQQNYLEKLNKSEPSQGFNKMLTEHKRIHLNNIKEEVFYVSQSNSLDKAFLKNQQEVENSSKLFFEEVRTTYHPEKEFPAFQPIDKIRNQIRAAKQYVISRMPESIPTMNPQANRQLGFYKKSVLEMDEMALAETLCIVAEGNAPGEKVKKLYKPFVDLDAWTEKIKPTDCLNYRIKLSEHFLMLMMLFMRGEYMTPDEFRVYLNTNHQTLFKMIEDSKTLLELDAWRYALTVKDAEKTDLQ